MPTINIRSVEGQEMLDLLYYLDNYAFTPTPPFPNQEEWEGRVKARKGPLYYAVFEDGEGVAITSCPTLTQNVRGKIFKMGGFAAVSSHPKVRRKGYVRDLMMERREDDGLKLRRLLDKRRQAPHDCRNAAGRGKGCFVSDKRQLRRHGLNPFGVSEGHFTCAVLACQA